jgi:hypothetical protein
VGRLPALLDAAPSGTIGAAWHFRGIPLFSRSTRMLPDHFDRDLLEKVMIGLGLALCLLVGPALALITYKH